MFFKGPYSTPEEKGPEELIKMIDGNQLSVTKEHPLEIIEDGPNTPQYVNGYYKNPRTPTEDTRFRTPVSVDWTTCRNRL